MAVVGIAIYDSVDGAEKTWASLHELEKLGKAETRDAVIVVKDENGEVSGTQTRQQSKGETTAKGALLGVVAGTILGGPIAGLAIGGVIGRYLGKHTDYGVSDQKVEMVLNDMQNGTSAIFVQLEEKKNLNVALIKSALTQHGGTIHEVMVEDQWLQDVSSDMGIEPTNLRESRS